MPDRPPAGGQALVGKVEDQAVRLGAQEEPLAGDEGTGETVVAPLSEERPLDERDAGERERPPERSPQPPGQRGPAIERLGIRGGPKGEPHAREEDVDVDANTLDLLTNSHTAYFLDRRGIVRGWSIWHRPQAVRTMTVERASVACLSAVSLGALLPTSARRSR